MQAIQTKLWYTRSGLPRVTAVCAAGKFTMDYEGAIGLEANHACAADALRAQLGWTQTAGYGPTVTGTLIDGSFVHVITNQ